MSSKVVSVSHGSAWVSDCYIRQDDMVGQGMFPGCISASSNCGSSHNVRDQLVSRLEGQRVTE